MDSGELTHTLDESLLVDPEESDRPVVDFLGSTPGRMALVAVVLIAALLAAQPPIAIITISVGPTPEAKRIRSPFDRLKTALP